MDAAGALNRLRQRRAWWTDNPPTNGRDMLLMYRELDALQAQADAAVQVALQLNMHMTQDIGW